MRTLALCTLLLLAPFVSPFCSRPRQIEDPSACRCDTDPVTKKTVCNSACPPGYRPGK